MTEDTVLSYVKKGQVWPEDDPACDPKKLCKISTKCLDKKPIVKFESDVVQILKGILDDTGNLVMERDETQSDEIKSPSEPSVKCDVCMFNKAAKTTHLCRQPVQRCMSCEKNSFLNPLTCFTCGSSLKREIGDDWGAVLVAGPDLDGKIEKAFIKDVEDVTRIITSKAPLIIGMRKEHVLQVFPENEKKIVPMIKSALKEIGRKNIRTIMIYVSCHGKISGNQGQLKDGSNEGRRSECKDNGEERKHLEKNKSYANGSGEVDGKHFLNKNNGQEEKTCNEHRHRGQDAKAKEQKEKSVPQKNAEKSNFLLGSEALPLAEFEAVLHTLINIKNFVIILDMCHAPKVSVGNKNMLQINSCWEGQTSGAVSGGSIFSTFLIQGLKGASENFDCCLQLSDKCKPCQDFFSRNGDFVSVESLFQYIKEHIDMKSNREGVTEENLQTPKIFVSADRVNIAYNTSQPVFIDFEVKKQDQPVKLGLKYITDFAQLKKRLYEECRTDESKENMTVKAKTYRGDVPEVVYDSLEKVMAAWINRNQLYVEFEPVVKTSTTNLVP